MRYQLYGQDYLLYYGLFKDYDDLYARLMSL